ncbi:MULTISPECIES: DUF4178 domain-containing protein [Niastella]|uniref:DUF4178 domain-containing protein n=1 Tax=Niastella soli TaxID=2821487 RepID=A0ABS3YSN2_9BACT|nr:DUF4178 domain-containing protein [Niastella soli]MBO9200899.1 DUF4178 domain-containing protein [Niastella soli]
MSITGIFTCPECQRAINAKNAPTNVIVCSHCFAPLKKAAGALNERINLLITNDTSSPIQIGTRGVWKRKSFEIIGRVQCFYEDALFNNWTMLLDDGDIMMLVEGYGQFAVYEKIALEIAVSFAMVARMEYGSDSIELNNNKKYLLEREGFCKIIKIEGEAWLFDEDGVFNSLELANEDGDRIALIGSKKNTDYSSFRIHYQSFADFRFQQLRNQSIDTVTKEIACKKCSATNRLYSWPFTRSYSCDACGACYEIKNGDSDLLRVTMKSDRQPVIPLQSTGTIRGVEYRLVGFAEKEDEEGYSWREYTLFSPVQGYAFLSEFNGHWIFLKETADAPVLFKAKDIDFYFSGKIFRPYNRYRYSLVYAQGEFPEKIFDNDQTHCVEYIYPPEIWVREMHSEGISWYHGTHLSGKELRTAFPGISLPYTIGVGAVQSAGNVGSTVLKRSMLGILALFLLLFFITMAFNRNQVVYDNFITLPDSTNLPMLVTQKFKLDKWRSNLEFDISAPVRNNWFEVGITLVNADNGTEYSIEKGVEKYSGYEDGESWSEGSDQDDAILHSIPAGNYFLEIQPARGDATVDSFSLRVTYDVPMWRNFFMFVIFALLPVVGIFFRGAYLESVRWQNSPFT